MSGWHYHLPCPECREEMDVRNNRVAFCALCAAIVDQVTGAAYNRHGQFIKNVVTEMLECRRSPALVPQ